MYLIIYLVGKITNKIFANTVIIELNSRHDSKPDKAQLGTKSDLKLGCLLIIYERLNFPYFSILSQNSDTLF